MPASATARPMPDVPPITALTVFSLKSMIAGPESVGWKGIRVEHQLDEQASRDGNEDLQLARLRDDGLAVVPAAPLQAPTRRISVLQAEGHVMERTAVVAGAASRRPLHHVDDGAAVRIEPPAGEAERRACAVDQPDDFG